MGYWTDGDVALKELRRWSPSCSFVKGLHVGNIPSLSNNQTEKSFQQPTQSHDVCVSHFELGPNWLQVFLIVFLVLICLCLITPH